MQSPLEPSAPPFDGEIRPSDTGAVFALEPIRWRLPLGLFLATLASTFYVGAGQALRRTPWEFFEQRRAEGWRVGARAFGWALARAVFPLLTNLAALGVPAYEALGAPPRSTAALTRVYGVASTQPKRAPLPTAITRPRGVHRSPRTSARSTRCQRCPPSSER